MENVDAQWIGRCEEPLAGLADRPHVACGKSWRVWVIAGAQMLALVALGVVASHAATEQPDEQQPVAGYDPDALNGFFIQDPSGAFRLNFGMYGQVRYNINHRRDTSDSTEAYESGFSLNRARLFFEGNYTDRYKFTFRANIDSEGQWSLLVADFDWLIDARTKLTVGQVSIALTREDWMYPQDLMAMEFSANDQVFAVATGLGLQLHQQASDRIRYWLALSNGALGSKREFPSPDDSDIMVSGRLELQPVGTGWAVWGDMVGRRGRPFAIMVGVAPVFLNRTDTSTQPGTVSGLNLDLNVNGDGYQATIAATVAQTNPTGSDDFYNWGAYAQAGYFVAPAWQTYVRWDVVGPGDQPGDLEVFNAPGIGVNYYPFQRTNRWRWTIEFNYLLSIMNRTIVAPSGMHGWLPSDEDGQANLRIQAQFGF